MSPIEQVHALFRGSAEFGKHLRSVALLLEVGGGGIGVYGVFAQGEALATWHPLVAFALVASSTVVRGWAGHISRFAELCRRESARAYALGEPVAPARAWALRDSTPTLASHIAKRLPASTIEEYYDAKAGEGEPRLREMYAHSSFHTWRLLRIWAWIMGIVGFALVAGSFAVVYSLATAPRSSAEAGNVLSALCSIALAVLTIRAVGAAVAAALSARETRRISDALLAAPLPSGDSLRSIVHEYDVERACGLPVPTSLYKAMRSRLARVWDERRQEANGDP